MKKDDIKIGGKTWREWYQMGADNALKENKVALAIGSAILAALDDRYGFAEKDY